MKNIAKLLVGILFSALVIAPSYAGEMSVTGGATATYTTQGDTSSAGKNIGISNELDFTASGELDNGYTWTYQVQLDGASTANDDTKLEIGTDMGTVGIYVSEGGLSAELAHGVGAMGTGFDYVSPSAFITAYDVDGFSNIQYHTPAGALPFGLGAKFGYVPNMNATSAAGNMSAKDSVAIANINSQSEGRDMQMLQVSAAPIDGLSIKGDIAEVNTEGGATDGDDGLSTNLGAKYTIGQISVGYTEGFYQAATGLTAGDATVTYDNKFYGIQFDINDNLAVSYNEDESTQRTRQTIVAGAAGSTTTDIAMDQTSLQLAYTVGGATIGITDVDVSQADYTVGKDESQTVVSLGISF